VKQWAVPYCVSLVSIVSDLVTLLHWRRKRHNAQSFWSRARADRICRAWRWGGFDQTSNGEFLRAADFL